MARNNTVSAKIPATAPSPEGAKRETGSLTPVTARGEATRQRILDAAEAVFGELGYYEASVSEITRRAKVAQGTFYLYFHTKREIFVELVEDLGTRLRTATSAAIAHVPDRLEAERLGFAAFFAFVAEHRKVYLIVQEAERVAPEAAAAYYRRISEGYMHGLSEAMAAGDIRPLPPEAVAYTLMGIAHFLALRWLIWPQTEAPTQIPPEIVDAAFAVISHGLAQQPHAEKDSQR